MVFRQLSLHVIRTASKEASKTSKPLATKRKGETLGSLVSKSIINYLQKLAKIGGGTVLAASLSTIAFHYYKNYISRELFQYYALEFNVLKQPSRELVEFLVKNFIIPNGFNVEKSRIMSSHVENVPGKRLSQTMVRPMIFYDEAENAVDIYLPQFYEVNGSFGHFLENSEHYFMVQDHRLNTRFFESTDLRYAGVDEMIICNHRSNEEILLCTEMAYAWRKRIGKEISYGVLAAFMGTFWLSIGLWKPGVTIKSQKSLIAGAALGLTGIYGSDKFIQNYNHNLIWSEEQRLAKKNAQLALGTYTLLEKGRRLNLLAYKMEGHQRARAYIDALGNVKKDRIPLTEKIKFAIENLNNNFGIYNLPEIPDEIVEEDQFYF